MDQKPTYEELAQKIKELEKEAVEQKRAEEESKHQKRRLESLIEYSSLAIVTLDEGHNIISCNRDFEKLFHFKESEIVGINLDELITGQESIKDATSFTKETLKGKAIHGSGKRKRKDGTYIDVEFTGVPVIIDGKVIGAYGIYQDISERKQAEEETERRVAQVELVHEVTNRINSELELKALFSEIVTSIYDAFDYYGVMLLLVDEKTNRLTMQSILDGYADIFPKDLWLAKGEGMTGYAAVTGETQLSGDVTKHPHYVRKGVEKTKSELAVPIKSGQEVIGVLDLQSDQFNAFDKTDVVVTETLAGQIAVAIKNARLYETVQQELTERKLAEKKLKELEKLFQQVTENVEEWVWEVDADGLYTYASPVVGKVLGYKPEELVGKKHFYDLFYPENREQLKKAAFEVFAKKKSFREFINRNIRKNGDIVWLSTSGMPVLDSDENLLGYRGTDLNITERKRAEEGLKESEEKYRSLVESTEDSIYLLDRNCTYLFMNKEHLSRIGVEKEKVIGRNYAEFHSEDDTRELVGEVEKVIETGKSLSYEYGSQRDDGYFIRTLSPVKDLDGRTVSITVVSKDITERKQHEEMLKQEKERFQILVEESPVGISLIGKDGTYKYLNSRFIKLLGYTLKDIPTGREWFKKAYPDGKYRKEIISTWIEDLKQHAIGKSRPRKYTVICKDGSEKIIQFNAVTLPDQDQMISCGDFTEIELEERKRKDLEAQLIQAQKMETIGTLVGGMAHDLNNIFSGIIGYPEMILLELPEDSPLRKLLLRIQKSGEKAAVMVQDLLTLARRGVVITEVVKLNSIISEQLKSPEYEKLKSFHPDVEEDTNLEKDLLNIKGSTVHLSKTVMNLASNAAEAMPDGGKIFISTENLYIDRPIRGYDQVEEGDYVVVTVSDTGIGISEEDIARIFEPFYTKKVMGRSGTGLGMAVVWGTVKDHKGYIDVESTEGKGTTFTLYFPVTREELAIDKSPILIEDYMGKGESILIVDDVEEQRDIASVMLKKLGYSVTSVSSGEEAIEYMKDNSADLLVLDMIMDPGIDGLETYKRILKLHPKQKAIIASGFSETDRVKKAKKLGAGAYVKKPYVLEKIGVVIKEELEK